MSRISKRIREKTDIIRVNNKKTLQDTGTSSFEDGHWTIKEKQLLLESIQEHGLADVKKLAADVKTRTPGQIALYLESRRSRLSLEYNRQKREETEGNRVLQNQFIIKWCSKIREAVDIKHRVPDFSTVLEEILEAAAKEESGLKPTEDEPNFGLIYMYLARVMSGIIPPSLPPAESWIMLHAWQSLTETLKKGNWEEEKHFLQNLHLRKFAPLEPEFKKMKRDEHWKFLQDSQKKGQIPDLKETAGSSTAPSDQKPSSSAAPEQEAPNSAALSEQEPSTSTSETADKYPIWNLNDHYYSSLLASLNPLTVPVKMLDKETEVVFGK